MVDIYVGIDPGSTNCAMVAWSPTRGLISTWKPKGKMPAGVMRLRRLQHEIGNELKNLERDGQIKKVAMEAYSMAEKYGQHASGEVGAAIKLAVLEHFCQFVRMDQRGFPLLVAPQQIKKFASGNGNLKKDMVPKEVYKRWAIEFNDMDLTIAYILARIAYAVDAEPEMTQFQRDIAMAVATKTDWDPILVKMTPVRRRLVRLSGRGQQ